MLPDKTGAPFHFVGCDEHSETGLAVVQKPTRASPAHLTVEPAHVLHQLPTTHYTLISPIPPIRGVALDFPVHFASIYGIADLDGHRDRACQAPPGRRWSM